MGPDQQRRNQPSPATPDAETFAALTARVDALERELAQLRTHSAPAPPPATVTSSDAAIKPAKTAQPKASLPKASLEDRIGSQLFSRIGVLALLIATALFLKWAIDNRWIGPVGRVIAGLAAGAVVILWSERFRRHGFSAFSYSLKAVGSGALYLALWAAFQLYHLLPAAVALTAMVLVTAWNAFMAWSQNSELLAAYALAGAFATPLLLSTPGNHEIFLFSYLLALDLATVLLLRFKLWPRLLLGAFPATAAFFFVWYFNWYNDPAAPQPVAITTLFLALFFFTFLTPSFRAANEQSYAPILEVFLPLANAAFTAVALYAVLQDAHLHDLLPWAAVLLSALYLGLVRLPPASLQTRLTSAVHLTLAVVFLTIAIPLKATGRSITIAWLTEGAALLWVSARFTRQSPAKQSPARQSSEARISANTLRRLSLLSLALGLLGLLVQPLWLYPTVQTAFFNARFATALFGIAIFAGSATIALRAFKKEEATSPGWLSIAGASILALNLTALLGTVWEIEALWPSPTGNPDADLQRSLAISAFLMAYGAALLAVGFWRRSAFLRWQALLLLVFTIGKAFLYDLRNLSQGYRVFSFLGLGALLMAISFAYQKDWLALRSPKSEAVPAAAESPSPEAESAQIHPGASH